MKSNRMIKLSDRNGQFPKPEVAASELLVVNIAELTPLNEFEGSPARGPLKSLLSLANAAIHVADGTICDMGRTEDVLARLPADASPVVLDATDHAVVPGFVDPHSHTLYAGSRIDEYALRIAGAGYDQISAMGGGVGKTIESTVNADYETLRCGLVERLNKALSLGTTTAEVKTGYWVTPDGESKALELIRSLRGRHPVDLVSTFHVALGLPTQFRAQPSKFADFIITELLPSIAGHADFFDIVCDTPEIGGFSVDDSKRLVMAGSSFGLGIKIHADEFSAAGGAELAVELGAASADHLCFPSEHSVGMLAGAKTVAVLLPATHHYLLAPRLADARRMIDDGVAVALGTDHGPSNPCLSMQFVMGLACSYLRLHPAEALVAATWNAACAIRFEKLAGCLAVGRPADFVILEANTYREIPFLIDQPLVKATVKKGHVFTRT